MHAGVLRGSADEAWWALARALEEHRATGAAHAVGLIDIAKAFDQVVRELVMMLATLAGCPSQVLLPWWNMADGLRVVATLADGVGLPRRRAVAIPQGDPLSMA